jgi:hypothetical protein
MSRKVAGHKMQEKAIYLPGSRAGYTDMVMDKI